MIGRMRIAGAFSGGRLGVYQIAQAADRGPRRATLPACAPRHWQFEQSAGDLSSASVSRGWAIGFDCVQCSACGLCH